MSVPDDNLEPLPGIEPELPPTGRPDLRVVEKQTGEVCPGCVQRDDKIEMLESEKKTWRGKFVAEKAKNDRAAKRNTLWPQAVELFKYWQQESGHTKTRFSEDRFWLLRPYLDADGLEACKRAVDGRLSSDWHMKRGAAANRQGPIHDKLEQIFENRAKFEAALGVAEERDQTTLDATAKLKLTRELQRMNGRARKIAARALLLNDEADPAERKKLLDEIQAITQEEHYGSSDRNE